jgi:branched-chain amino acid transport system substrate-binding protein
MTTIRSICFRRIFAVSIAATLGFAAPLSPTWSADVKVGVPLPQSGGAARWGSFSLRGATLAAKQINDAGGVAGMKIELIKADDQCVPAEGVSATHRLLNIEKVDVIFGPMCSSVAKALQPIVESAKIPMLLPTTSDPEITYKAGVGGYKWTFRNYPTDEIRALIVLENAVKKGSTRFALLAADNDFGRSAVEFNKKYQARFPAARFTSIDFFSLKETDFRPVLSKAKAADVQVILLYATAGDTIQVVGRQMRELGMAGKVKVMGIGDLVHPDNIKALSDVLEGAVEGSLWAPQLENARSKKFVDDYAKMFDGEVPSFLSYAYWETMHLLAQAIREAKGVNRDALQKALQNIKYESVLGPVRFDDHHQANLPMMLIEVKGGKPVVMGTFYSQPVYPK